MEIKIEIKNGLNLGELNISTLNKEMVLERLSSLEKRFDAMQPERVVTVTEAESGVEGFIVVWNGVENPKLGRVAKGGTRISPTLTLDEVKMLARTMALKNAAAGLPLGGAKSGLRADPTAPDFETTYRRFISLCKPELRENGGLYGGFGFDIGAQPIHAVWACDELKSTRSFTGKTAEMGGTDYDKEGIAGLGVATAAKVALSKNGRSPEDCTFAVQGLGAMGAGIVRYFTELGAKVTYISDPKLGGTYEMPSPPPKRLLDAVIAQDFLETSRILKQIDARKLDLDAVLSAEVGVLFPAATQDVIDESNAHTIRANFVIEGANNPCSAAARTLLFQENQIVVPDFLANAGGIIAAYVELTAAVTPAENARSRQNVVDAKKLTIEKITQAVGDSMNLAAKFGIEIVQAGMFLTLRKMLD